MNDSILGIVITFIVLGLILSKIYFIADLLTTYAWANNGLNTLVISRDIGNPIGGSIGIPIVQGVSKLGLPLTGFTKSNFQRNR